VISLVGVLPVSAINVGLVAALGGLTAEIAALQADITALAPAIAGQVEVALDFPPDPPSVTAALEAALDPLELAACFSPGALTVGASDLTVDVGVQLGLIETQLAGLQSVGAKLTAGLAAPAISGWSYSGEAAGFGETLAAATATGFGQIEPDATIAGLVIATEDAASWGSFSKGFTTGGRSDGVLRYHGELGGGQWNTGVATLLVRLELFLLKLRGLKAGLEASLNVALGLELPAVDVVVDAGLAIVADLGIDGLLENMVNVQADLTAQIGAIQLKIDALLALSADLSAQLSAGGLALWSYSGRAGAFGAEVRDAIAAGIPQGNGPRAHAYGLALAGESRNMAAFSLAFGG
jgi:hypothetical protein